MLNQK